MSYIKLSDQTYPHTERSIRSENPQTSYPAGFPTPEDYEWVFPAPQPAYDPITQYVREIAPVVAATGKYEQQFETVALDAETVAANVVAGKAALKVKATNKREQVETGGTIVGGMPVKTDTVSQSKLTGALNFVGRKPTRIIKWKTAADTFVSINKATIEALSDAIGEFVAACYDAEADHYAAIDALTTPAQVAAYDVNTGWPA